MSAPARPHTQPTQADQILAALQRGQSLTPAAARQFYRCDRLGARIFELKRRGHTIQSRLVKVPGGKHVAEYSMPVAALPAPIKERAE